jgi:hypothetical protein
MTKRKFCSKCKIEKTFSAFDNHQGYKDGKQNYCRKCSTAYNKNRTTNFRQNKLYPKRNTPKEKQCRRCQIVKSAELFRKNVSMKDGLSSWCKECAVAYQKNRPDTTDYKARYDQDKTNGHIRRRRLARTFNITVEYYDALFELQGRRCAICRAEKSGNKKDWAVDHDHACCRGAKSCGKCIRGILCSLCNMGLGSLGDNAAVLFKAITYLAKPPAQSMLPSWLQETPQPEESIF